MKLFAGVMLLAVAILTPIASAQQAADSVTVTGTQLRAQVERYLGKSPPALSSPARSRAGKERPSVRWWWG